MTPLAVQVRLSIYYLLFYATIAVFSPYFNLYLASRGLTAEQVGLVLAVMPLIGIITQPLWGLLNDKFHRQKETLVLGLVIPVCVLVVVPRIHILAWYFAAVAIFAMFQSPVTPVADSMTIQITGVRHYGSVRLFGSLGYALIVAAASRIYHHFSISRLPELYFTAALLALVGVALYPKPRRISTQSHSAFSGIRKLINNRRFILLLCFTFLVNIGQWINSNFFTLYYHDLHRPLGVLGLIYAVGAMSEIPFFFLAGRLISKYGPERVFILGACVFTFRWLVLTLEPPTPIIFLMQLLHGLSFGLTFAAGVALGARVSDVTNQVSAQTVYSAVNTGCAAVIGSILGGLLLGHLGPRGIYAIAGAVSLAGLLCMMWYGRYIAKSRVPHVNQSAHH